MAAVLAQSLRENGFQVEVSGTLDALADQAKLDRLDLVVPGWTQGTIKPSQLSPLL